MHVSYAIANYNNEMCKIIQIIKIINLKLIKIINLKLIKIIQIVEGSITNILQFLSTKYKI